ncbi:MAG TPA: cache domain-containing protein [Deltaproteobacteria bacterium]|nr:cache domain-containing protein [Deltaproteobacteria bacterium]HQI80725.1 cache domain-containing protein [Deltaproteobacteria bacterium]
MRVQEMSLKWKITLMGITIIVAFSLIIYFLILPYMETEKIEERRGKLRAVVNSVVSHIDYYERALRRNASGFDPSMPGTIEDAKALVIRNISDMRYDKTEYFFILDGNGTMIMHPMKPELVGKNMLDVKDPKGVLLFRDMVMNSQKDGEAFVHYIWQSKYSPDILEPQITYARYYWPWDWVVCSSLYTQDITDAMYGIRVRSAVYILAAAFAMLPVLLGLVYLGLSRPIGRMLRGIQEIHDGNLDYRIPVLSLDEIGYVSQEFNQMVSTLQQSRDAIVRSEEKYRQLSDMLPDIIYETDTDLNITYFNKAGYRLTGYSEEDIQGGLAVADLVEEGEYRRLRAMLDVGEDVAIITTHRVIRKDGSDFHGENNASLMREHGRVVGLRGSIRDVTDRRRMEEQLIQAQKMDTIGTLAGGLAHDFNNVLGGIVSTISIMKYEMYKEQALNPESLRKHIDIMERSGQRAVDMVQQLLTLSRKRDAVFTAVDLGAAVQSVVKICGNTFDKSIEIKVDLPRERSLVQADPTQLEQILLNLCVNANHAMTLMRPEGQPMGGILTISLARVKSDRQFCITHPEAIETDYWKLSVADTGVGIEKHNLSKIFIPFFTTKDKGAGTGLGLSMVYTIVQQHHGFTDVYSEKGMGSNFNVYLPVFESEQECEEAKDLSSIPRGEGLILVVDDEEVMRHTASTILGKCGYRVITAMDGEEGVRVFRERHHEINAVLLDLVMPRKSGEQAYLEMKRIDPNLKVILTSGFRKDERVDMALSCGINGFIQKPYSLERLAHAVYELVRDTAQGAVEDA